MVSFGSWGDFLFLCHYLVGKELNYYIREVGVDFASDSRNPENFSLCSLAVTATTMSVLKYIPRPRISKVLGANLLGGFKPDQGSD